MRVLPTLLGGLALFTAAFPVADVAVKPETTALSIRDQELALPSQFLPTANAVAVLSDDFDDVENDLVKRKSRKVGSTKPKAVKPKKKTKSAKAPKTKAAEVPKTKAAKATKTKAAKATKTKAAKAAHTAAAKATKTKAAKATHATAAKATKTKAVKVTHTTAAKKSHTTGLSHTKTRKPKTTGTAKTTGFKTRTKTGTKTGTRTSSATSTATGGTCPAWMIPRKGAKDLCGPTTGCGAGSSTNTKGKKKTKVTRAIALVQGLKQSVETIPHRLTRVFKRADPANLQPKDIIALRSHLTESKSGRERYLAHGSNQEPAELRFGDDVPKVTRFPNDSIFDGFANTEFYRYMDGLHGCTGVMIVSPKGMFTAHLWQTFMGTADGRKMITDNLIKGFRNKHHYMSKGDKLENMWTFKNQFGIKDSPSEAWSTPSDIHVVINSPNSADGPISAKAIEDAIKKTIPNIPQANWHKSSYTPLTAKQVGTSSGVKGTMTAYYDGHGGLGIYSEERKIMNIAFTASGTDDNPDHQAEESDGEDPPSVCPQPKKKDKKGRCCDFSGLNCVVMK